jgi:hypothetical protein
VAAMIKYNSLKLNAGGFDHYNLVAMELPAVSNRRNKTNEHYVINGYAYDCATKIKRLVCCL